MAALLILLIALQAGQIIDTRSGAALTEAEFMDRLAAQDVIYVGEEHHNRWHIAAALKIIDALVARQRRPALAMEMFGWDGQPALDRYAGGESGRDMFLRDVQWAENWGGRFEDYEPLIAAAQRYRMSITALNPPLPLVRRVAKRGLAEALFDPEMGRWKMQSELYVDNAAYRATIVDQLRRCHGGMPDDAYERMYQASLFRDEAMARTIAALLARQAAEPGLGPVVSYTGGGHIQHGLPIPERVARRRPAVKAVTVYLAALDPSHADERLEVVDARIADYVWLTPVGENGPPRRCGS